MPETGKGNIMLSKRVYIPENIIINGDSIVEMEKLPPECVDLIFADPPYWMRTEGVLTRVEGTEFDGCDDEWDQFTSLEEYEKFTTRWLQACYRVLKPNGSIWVIGGMQCIHTIGAKMQELGFWLINDVVWHKKNPTPNFQGTRLNNSHETLIWACKSKKAKFTFHYKTARELNVDTVSETEYAAGVRKQMGSVWRFSVCSGDERLKNSRGEKLHSTQKPLALLKRIISISSSVGDLVLDPFGGTMTTGVAAKDLGRKYIMLEKSTEYCQYGEQRLSEIFYFVDDGPIARAAYDEKPLKVTMPEMISAKYFTSGEWFYLKNGVAVAQLQEDGKLLLEGKSIDMHTCAAVAKGVKARRLNGFEHLFVKRNGCLVALSTIRDNYRESLTSQK